MNNHAFSLTALLVALLLPAAAAASSNMYLQFTDANGVARVIECQSGACVTDQLVAGQYSVLVCDAEGTIVPTDMTLDYTVVAPVEASAGQASGKRMHQAIVITKQLDREAVAGNVIAVDAAGIQLVIGVSATAVDAATAKIGKSRSNIQNN
jgi:hypothetical protein